jgi:hypothetical protein
MTLGDLFAEQYAKLKQEGVKVHFDMYKGDYVNAKDAEAVIKRLYLQIENLTGAYEGEEK